MFQTLKFKQTPVFASTYLSVQPKPIAKASNTYFTTTIPAPKPTYPLLYNYISPKRFYFNDWLEYRFFVPAKTVYYTPVSPLVTISDVKPRGSRVGDVLTLLDKFKEVNRKFSPYESLTGISSQRPELLLLSEFKPLFDEGFRNQSADQFSGQNLNGLNDYGDYIDIQMQVQNLHHYNLFKTLKDIKDSDPDAKKAIDLRAANFLSAIQSTIKNVNHLYNLARQLEDAKDAFDLKSDKFIIQWESIVRNHYNDYYSWFLRYFGSSRNFISMTPSKFITKFGYQEAGVNNFSSTKIYLQLLSEFRNLIGNFSAKLLGQPTDRQKNDSKASTLNTNVYSAFFDISRAINDLESPLYSDIARLNARSIGSAVPRLSFFFEQIDKTFVFPRAEDKISFYTHYLSREFRYSTALSNPDTQNFIAQNYGYRINTQGSNFDLIDFVVGRIGGKITDAFSAPSPNSLASPAHVLLNDSLILPFEGKYLELDGSVFTPGSEYFIESIFDKASNVSPDGSPFDVSNLDTYTNTMNQVTNRFTEFVDRMRFFYMIPAEDYWYYHSLSFNDKTTMESPQRLIETIYDGILDGRQNPKYNIANDPMSALLNLAYKDKTLKALLYMYVIISNSGTSSTTVNTAEIRRQLNLNDIDQLIIQPEQSAIEQIVQQIQDRVRALVTTRFNYLYNDIFNIFGFYSSYFRPYAFLQEFQTYRAASFGQNFAEITAENLANSLRRGSPALNFLKSTVARAINAFRSNGALNQSRTLYSDINDSMLAALTFDLCLTIFDTHVNTRFLNRYVTKDQSTVGREFYTISNKQSNTGAAVSLVITKVSDEVDLTIQCVTGITAMQRRVVDSSIAILNSIRKADTVKVLNEVIATVGSRKYLSHLMAEQQLILAKFLTDEVRIKLFSGNRSGELQVASQETQAADDDLVILDDLPTTGNMRNAFFAYFAQGKYTTRKAFNSRVLTVGVPHGFARNIREKIKVDLLDKSYNKKQVDLINLSIYKVDIEMQDIIFKPQKFMFELSRFVLNNEQQIHPLGIDSNIDRIIRSVPTRDYSLEVQDVQDHASLEQSLLFTSPAYSFLTKAQKYQLVQNHVSTHFVEMYLRYLTGMHTSEHNFEFILDEKDRLKTKKSINDEFIKTLVTSNVSTRIARPVTWEDIIHSGFWDSYSVKTERIIQKSVQTITNLANVSTVVSDPSYEAQRLIRPKEFERIFHVIVDPNDYEIDIVATSKTVQGREALQKLRKQGLVIDVDENTLVTSDRTEQNKRVKVLERNTSDNNLVFEKYFVNFETVLPPLGTSDPVANPENIRREK